MKTKRLLRVLSILGFLLLIAPFYDSCNGHRMKQADATAEPTVDSTAVVMDSTKTDSTEIANVEVDSATTSVENNALSFAGKAYEFIDDEDSENAIEFATISIDCISDFNQQDLKNITQKKDGHWGIFFQLKNFCFLLIVVTTFLILICSFKNERLAHKFSTLNLILLLITIICLFLEGLFETISQIKWGYYTFIISNLLIFYYSKMALKSQVLSPNS